MNRSDPAATPYAQALIEIGRDEGLLGEIHDQLEAIQHVIEESRDYVNRLLVTGREHPAEWGAINARVKDALGNYYFERTRRRPMILPFMVKV